MKLFDKFNLGVFLLLIAISIYLVLRWLPAGLIVAGGDVGIPVLNPQKVFGVQSHTWWDTHATGVTSPVTYTALPFYFGLTVLDKIGVTADINQKLLFFFILFGGSLSIYFLALNFSFKRGLAFIAALFYIFNLISLSVWQRGVHNAMLLLLLAPLSLLILVWGIKHKKYTSIILLNIASFLFSYVFGSLGYLFSLWLLWTIYILIVLFRERKDKSTRKFILIYFFILIISWLGTNSWWIINFLSSSGYVLDQFNPAELKERGSDVLVALKSYHEPGIILRGINSYSHYVTKNWGDVYLTPFFILLSWIPTLIVFSTTLVRSNYKSTGWRFLFLLIIVVLIISKGVNPPLGVLNKIPYDLFPLLAPLRNPYEKVGILLVIPFSLFFALGIEQINSYLKSKKLGYLQLITGFALVACLIILVWPLWFGKLFVSGDGKQYVHSIPPYYEEASRWMAEKTKADDTRILHLPLAWWESIDYNWGYTGIEPNQYFFEGSSIGYHVGVNGVDSRIRDLLLLVHDQDTDSLQKAFASLNIGWVIIHNETIFRDRMLEPPERINKWLATNPYFLEHIQDFGPLSIWRVKDQYRAGHFYPAGKLVSLKNPPALIPKKTWEYLEHVNDSYITETEIKKESLLEGFFDKRIIFSENNDAKKVEVILNEDGDKNLAGNNFNLPSLDITYNYQISFEILSGGSSPLFLIISHDNDPLDNEGRVRPYIVQELKLPNQLQWQKIMFNYSPPLNATSAILSFTKAQDTSFVKNLKVEKILTPDPILEDMENTDPQPLGAVKVEWDKINPTLYNLNLSQQAPPYVLIFSETFHPLWQITDIYGKELYLQHFTINGFANGWLVDKPLPEQIKVEFTLQRVFVKSIVISVLVFMISTSLLLYLDYRKKFK